MNSLDSNTTVLELPARPHYQLFPAYKYFHSWGILVIRKIILGVFVWGYTTVY